MTREMAARREQMVAQQIEARGVQDPLVLQAMRTVPREAFLPPALRACAYDDSPLPIAADQTISQPYMVALMIEALGLRGGERVLEIGCGSGYAAAVLASIVGEVYTVERVKALAVLATRTLRMLNYQNVAVLHGDGTRGWPAHVPFDAIVVAAGGPTVPVSLKSQLKVGGRLVIPVGDNLSHQELIRVTRRGETDFSEEKIAEVRFVPLIGAEGWEATVVHEPNESARPAEP